MPTDPNRPRDAGSLHGATGRLLCYGMIARQESVWDELKGAQVVLDLECPFVYVGRLLGVAGGYLLLEDADAHDLRDTPTTREKYILDCRRCGVSPNRRQVWVSLRQIVGVSRLEDVIV